jgi:large subunit ribosomal protein L25
MLQFEMAASVRTTKGKGPMRRLRQEGMTPAVVYGAGSEALSLQLNTKALMANLLEFHRRNTIVTLKIDDGPVKHVVIGEVQTDPVHNSLIHTDFCEIDLEQPRRYRVPVSFTGVAKGVDFGGDLHVFTDTIVLEGKPLDIPDDCTLDITNLNIGDEYTFSAFAISDSLKMISKADEVCVRVSKKLK